MVLRQQKWLFSLVWVFSCSQQEMRDTTFFYRHVLYVCFMCTTDSLRSKTWAVSETKHTFSAIFGKWALLLTLEVFARNNSTLFCKCIVVYLHLNFWQQTQNWCKHFVDKSGLNASNMHATSIWVLLPTRFSYSIFAIKHSSMVYIELSNTW